MAAKKTRYLAKPRGAVNVYDEPYHVSHVRALTMLGATNEQLASVFEVNEQTIKLWMNKYPEFRAAAREGKQAADARVAESLYKRAVGFSHPETVVKMTKDGEVKKVQVTRHYAPDTQACQTWLYNRQPELWRARTGAEAAPETGNRVVIEFMGGPPPRPIGPPEPRVIENE